MRLEKSSFCKVNLLLNILGKRPDGFHELETLMQPVGVRDVIVFERRGTGITLTCSNPALPVDGTNLVYRAAEAFREAAGVSDGVVLHLDKRIPMAAGLGGGSGNAATTLLGLNELFGKPLPIEQLSKLAARLGSDIPFFLQEQPALATGRGELVQSLAPFPALKGAGILLIHPGFGVSTPWAYQNLARFPKDLSGRSGRASAMLAALRNTELSLACEHLYNSLEAPVLEKYPILKLYQEFLLENGAAGALMSGSGSTTFALTRDVETAEQLRTVFLSKFGANNWTAVVAAN